MGYLIKLSGKKIEEIEYFLDIAAQKIIDGSVIAFPTNSVYGIGGDPTNLEVNNRLCNIKFRDKSKGFLLLVTDMEEAKKIAVFNENAEKLARHFWPGQLTLILKKRQPNIIPDEITGSYETVGLRIPENEIIHKILSLLKEKKRFGGIIGTSANYSGEPPATCGDEIIKNFLTPIDLVLDGGESKSKIATTIVDCSTNSYKIDREGYIRKEEIENVLKVN